MKKTKAEKTTTHTLRLPVRLFSVLEELASRDNRSVNGFVNLVLEDYVKSTPQNLPVNEQELQSLVTKVVRRILAERSSAAPTSDRDIGDGKG
jgi:hypothetical protein